MLHKKYEEELIETFNVKNNLYADDMQVLTHMISVKFSVVNRTSKIVCFEFKTGAPRSDSS